MTDSDELFAAIIEQYEALGFPHEVIGQWTLPANDVNDLIESVRHYQPKNVLEVGTFVGLSTMLIALSANQDTRVTSVDPNFPIDVEMGSMGSKIGEADGSRSTHDIARAVARRLNVDDRINLIAGGFASDATFASRRVRSDLIIPIVGPKLCVAEGPFDLVFIDGLHYAEVVENDLELASQHLAVGGIILMHDCIGMWGTNVRCGILRFLARHPDWEFLHPPFQSLYRSIGIVFRSDEHPELSRELLTQPNVNPSIARMLKPFATSLIRRLQPSLVIEIASGEAALAQYFKDPINTQVVQVTEDLCTQFEDHVQNALSKGCRSDNLLVVSVGTFDVLADATFAEILNIIGRYKLVGAIFRTPPGERGSACQYSRPLRRWVEMADKAGAQVRSARMFDLDPSRFLFVKNDAASKISTSLCSVVLVTSKGAAEQGKRLSEFSTLSEYQAEVLEQQDIIDVHYGAAFSRTFSEVDNAVSANETLKAQVASQSAIIERQKNENNLPWWQKLVRFGQSWTTGLVNINPDIASEDALVHASFHNRPTPCLILSWTPSTEELDRLLADPRIGAIGISDPSDALLAPLSAVDSRVVHYSPNGQWTLPKNIETIYFVGPLWRLKRRMVADAWWSGIRNVYTRAGRFWLRLPLGSLYRLHLCKHRMQEQLAVIQLKIAYGLKLIGLKRVLPDKIQTQLMTYEEAFDLALTNVRPRSDYVPGRIVLVCGNLSPGGAERQVANTLVGLKSRGFEDVHFLAHYLGSGPSQMDFHLGNVRAAGVSAREIERATTSRSDANIPYNLRQAGGALPATLIVDISDLVRELDRLRPQVVHAWLDWDNIRAGVAAAISGVPRILLSGRNLAPYNFKLHQPYMRPGYRALARLPNIEFLNNSHAGADDYADWINIPRDKIKVIYNGLNFGNSRRLNGKERSRKRRQMGIDDSTFLVGGVFRFEDEKRPMLWLESVAKIAEAEPRARFVLYGQGSMRPKIEAKIRTLGLEECITIAGVTKRPLEMMALMDVLLLTSYGEGLPNVLIEAQSVGTPVVCTRSGGAAEAIYPNITGKIVDVAEAVDLANAVIDLLRDETFQVNAAIAGPEFVRTKFGQERMIDDTIAAYRILEDHDDDSIQRAAS